MYVPPLVIYIGPYNCLSTLRYFLATYFNEFLQIIAYYSITHTCESSCVEWLACLHSDAIY